MKKPRIYTVSFARVWPMYVEKVGRKGRSEAELIEVVRWLTGYSEAALRKHIAGTADFETFVTQAPKPNPARKLVTGVICGIRVEEIEDPVTREIRYIDKLVEELAKGKAMEKILRG